MEPVFSIDDWAPWIGRWRLVADGAPIVTHSSRLLPVLRDGEPLMLKVATALEERWGAHLMVWWAGTGAARVLEHEGDAILLERATGSERLDQMAINGRDDEATRILCGVAAELHRPRPQSPPALVPLTEWFQALEPMVHEGGIFSQSASAARKLLADPADIVILHGDIHHGNVLDFGSRGWLAIDPKGLIGERAFDYANLLWNPNLWISASPGRLARQVDQVRKAAGLERVRLLEWIVAWAGLSAVWSLENADTATAESTLAIGSLALAEITRL